MRTENKVWRLSRFRIPAARNEREERQSGIIIETESRLLWYVTYTKKKDIYLKAPDAFQRGREATPTPLL